MQLDILAFGAHPDDVEIGIGGTLIKHAHKGYKCGIVDLTAGEAASNGTPEVRRKEALTAAAVMGVAARDCLALPDAQLQINPESLRAVIEIIRRYRPQVVIGPYREDRHPDHRATSQLVRQSSHLAGLGRYPADGEPHRPPVYLEYFLAVFEEPSFIVDISEYYEMKLGAIAAHFSQFGVPVGTDWSTLVNNPRFNRLLQSRDQYLGSLIQCFYAEGMYMDRKMMVDDLTAINGWQRKMPVDTPVPLRGW